MQCRHDLSVSVSLSHVHILFSQLAIYPCAYRRKKLRTSVTRLGDFLLLGQAFKAGGNNYFTQFAHIVWQFL